MSTRFSCVGCGKCCTGHHVPLTLAEAVRWVEQAGALIVLVEAFLDAGPGMPAAQHEHARRRSLPVWCGALRAHVAITFAAFNPGRCIRLDADDRCTIYAQRPLVCRIYPFEINPHLPLRSDLKDCPPQAWQQGPVLMQDGRLLDAELATLIERSRQADRDDIAAKAAICMLLGLQTSALKGDGFITLQPEPAAFLAAAERVRTGETVSEADAWQLHVSRQDLAEQLAATGARIAEALAEDQGFIPLAVA